MKEINGYPNYYITEDGKVWSEKRNKYIKAYENRYMQIRLFSISEKKNKNMKIHRLVAEAFIPNPNHYNEVNHIDGNKTNNRIENLEWCNHVMNINHAWKTGLYEGLRKRIVETKIKKVVCVETGEIYNSAMEAGLAIGMRKTSISTAIYKGHKCKGKTYKYLEVAK